MKGGGGEGMDDAERNPFPCRYNKRTGVGVKRLTEIGYVL